MPLMPLKHADIWLAIDRLAERHGLSPSGLARKAALSPTVFNPSKRESKQRKRWPSTESIARILQATGTGLDEFMRLAAPDAGTARKALPLLRMSDAARPGRFDENGHPAGDAWENIAFPALPDPHAFILEMTGKSAEPVYRDGDRIVLSPAAPPRRDDRVALRLKKGEIMPGRLNRDITNKIELIPFTPGAAAVTLVRAEIEWVYRIVWASQ